MTRTTILCCLLLLPLAATAQPPKDADIDFNKARQLLQKEQKGEKLTPEEKAYLDKAKEALRKRNEVNQGANQGPAKGGKDSTGLIPLTDLGTGKYKGETGGLYGDGMNQPPAAHLAAAMKEAAKIRPLDRDGHPSDHGKIVLVSFGMSNTTQEFSAFMQLANADSSKSPSIVFVDGAQSGQAAEQWNGPTSKRVWQVVDDRLKSASITAKQVQVVWLKQALIQPGRFGEFPEHARKLEAENLKTLHVAKERFPNLRIAYLSSRIYAGYATTPLNPEPYAYEGAFSVRWLIQRQIESDKELSYDAEKGQVVAPLLLWGPYLWADGSSPRKTDGLTYQRTDLVPGDGTHPSLAGRKKVGEQLLRFFKNDPTAKRWFTKVAEKE
ncbi:MAG: hypothetical protein ACJ8F7_08450 [Gemmataceae bacterium]